MSRATGAPTSDSSIADARSETPGTRLARADHVRFVFLDALRGAALVFMVLNHTGRWWQDGIMGWPRYYTIYVTMAVAAPIFLFLVGFCLPLSKAREEPGALPMLWKYAVRGARLILAGLLLNLLVFPEDPIYSNGVLQTIGVSILAAAAGALLLRRPGMRPVVTALAVLLYLAFGWSFGALTAWVQAHPTMARILFFEFPPWPWVSLVLVGLVLGDLWVGQRDARARARFMWLMAGAAVLCFAVFFGYDWWAGTLNRWTFKRDYILNNHWTPRGASSIWVLGMIFALMPAFYCLAEVLRWRMTWLVTLGRTALVLYFIHQLIVLTLVNQLLGLRMNDWPRYLGANLVLLIVLLGIGKFWLGFRTMSWYLEVSRKYAAFAAFSGRARRREYWMFVLVNTVITALLTSIDIVTAGYGLRLGLLYSLATLIPGIAVTVRRLHDTDRTGWWLFLALVPLIGQLPLFIFLVQDSHLGENRYGRSPKPAIG